MNRDIKSVHPQNLLNTAEAAKMLGISAINLFRRRKNQLGPPYYRIGNRVVYSREDLIEFLKKIKVEK